MTYRPAFTAPCGQNFLSKGGDATYISGVVLLQTLWAFSLALTIAIFPIAMPQAHAHEGYARALQAQEADHQHHGAGTAHHHEHAGAVSADHHGKKQSGEQAPSCCGTVACHAFLTSVTPDLRITRNFIRLVSRYAAEQTDSRSPNRLDRPPRPA